MKQKLENFASSYIESIAEKRGRNAEWAKSSVVRSESITATNALELKVIDLIAKDLPELLGELGEIYTTFPELRRGGATGSTEAAAPRRRPTRSR